MNRQILLKIFFEVKFVKINQVLVIHHLMSFIFVFNSEHGKEIDEKKFKINYSNQLKILNFLK